jgi:predicted permease
VGVTLGAAFSVFAIIICGYLAGRYGVVADSGARSLNNYVYYFALPALLFLSLADAPLSSLANWGFLGANLGGILASFALSAALARLAFGKKRATPAIHGMIGSFGNTGYMGIPLLIAAFGKEAALPAALATVVHNLPVIALVILSFEAARAASGGDAGKRVSGALLGNVARAVLLNPITLSVLAGMAAAVSGVGLPKPLEVFAGLLSDAAGPTALFALGLGLVGQTEAFGRVRTSVAELAAPVTVKLLFQPLVTALLVAYVFHLEGLWAATAVIMAALPVGASVYIFAQRYEDSVDVASLAVLFSTVISVATVPVLLTTVVGP